MSDDTTDGDEQPETRTVDLVGPTRFRVELTEDELQSVRESDSPVAEVPREPVEWEPVGRGGEWDVCVEGREERTAIVQCDRCHGRGNLGGSDNGNDRIRCPDCAGDGGRRVSLSELPVSYCPWCDEERPHADNVCVECGSGE